MTKTNKNESIDYESFLIGIKWTIRRCKCESDLFNLLNNKSFKYYLNEIELFMENNKDQLKKFDKAGF